MMKSYSDILILLNIYLYKAMPDVYVFEFYTSTYFGKTIMHFTYNGEMYAKINGVSQKLDILQVQE